MKPTGDGSERREKLKRTSLKWLLAALAAQAGWGTYPVLARYLQTVSCVPSMTLIGFSNVLILTLLVPFIAHGTDRQIFRLPILWLFAAVVMLRSITNLLAARFTLSIYVQTAHLLTPFIVVILSALVFRERIPRWTGHAILLTLIGEFMVMSSELGQAAVHNTHLNENVLGIALALASSFFLALYLVLIRQSAYHEVRGESMYCIQTTVLAVSACSLSILLGEDWSRWRSIGTIDWLVFAAWILCGWVGANLAQIAAIRRLGAPLVSSLLPLRLIVVLVLGAFLLGEELSSVYQAFGAVLVLVTLTWYLWQQRGVAAEYDGQL